MGGAGKIVEADETYYGQPKARASHTQRRGRPTKRSRGPQTSAPSSRLSSAAVAFAHSMSQWPMPANVAAIVRENVHRESRLQTDESRLYPVVGNEFAAHETVNHSANEYARGDVTTNTVETYFSVFKRGMRGTYQHCKEKHLHRYLAEFDFRFNNRTALGVTDGERATLADQGYRRQASHVSSTSLIRISK